MSNIAEIYDGWSTALLKDICELITKGSTPTSYGYKYQDEGIRFIKAESLDSDGIASAKASYVDDETHDFLKRSILQGDDLLFSIAGTIGRVGRVREIDLPANTNQALAIIRLKPGAVDHKYLFYYLKSDAIQKEFLQKIVGVGRANLSLTNLGEFKIPIAPQEQQKRIVAEIEKQFSRLDEAVANLKRVKANLKRYKAAVLKAAVEGKLTEEWRKQHPDVESADKLLERILAERRNRWGVAELAKMEAKGKVPKNDKWKERYKEADEPKIEETYSLPSTWVWTNLGQLAWSVKDGPHYSPKYSESGVPFISGGNIRPESIDFEKTKFITPKLHAKLSERCKPEFGDLLYTKGGTTGIARVNTETREFNVWVHVAVLRLVDSIDEFYLQHCLNAMHCYQQSQRYTHGVGNQDLGLTRMIWITVPLPPIDEQAQIFLEIEKHVSVISEVEAEIDSNLRRAGRLRQSILKQAFLGQLES